MEDLFMGSATTQILTATAVFAVVTAVAFGLRYLAIRAVRRWATATTTPFSAVILDSFRLPSLMWCLLIGLYTAVDTAELPQQFSATALKILFSLLVISVTVATANLSGTALQVGLKQSHIATPATGLTLTFMKVVIWVTGGLVLLGGLGMSITPVLTALGVGGLAVALALQDTLSNFFAGIHLLIEQPIRVGDFIKLESGQEGYVEDISWRTTRIRMPSNDMVILPNSKLTQSVLVNYHLPDPRRGISIVIGVPHDADPDMIERVLLEETLSTIGAAPSIRFIPGVGESSLNFSVNCHVREFNDHALVQHELRKRMLKRLKREGIQIPLPQQTVYLRPSLPPASA
jgi:small-conductance mechanosensitive channel